MDQLELATHEDEVLAATDRMVLETKRILADLRESNATFHDRSEQTRLEIAEAQGTMQSYRRKLSAHPAVPYTQPIYDMAANVEQPPLPLPPAPPAPGQPAAAPAQEWMPFGVFALAQGGEG